MYINYRTLERNQHFLPKDLEKTSPFWKPTEAQKWKQRNDSSKEHPWFFQPMILNLHFKLPADGFHLRIKRRKSPKELFLFINHQSLGFDGFFFPLPSGIWTVSHKLYLCYDGSVPRLLYAEAREKKSVFKHPAWPSLKNSGSFVWKTQKTISEPNPRAWQQTNTHP